MSRFGRLHALGFILLGVVFLVLGFDETLRSVRLDWHGVPTTATVDETRILRDRWGVKSHEVRYAFMLPNDQVSYSRTDSTGRRDLWSALPQQDWQQASRTKQVNIKYLAANPWINHPVTGPGVSPWEYAPMAALGLVAIGFGAWLLVMFWWTGVKYWEL